MNLDKPGAARAMAEKVAKPLGTSVVEAAFGIHDLINETMAAAAKTHIAEKGGNPKIVTISAFGGAGPVHAYGLAKKIGAPRILVPPLAGVGSAMGFFTAPVAFDLSRSHRVTLDDADFGAIETLFQELECEGAAILQQTDRRQKVSFERTLMMRFVGQGAETDLQIPRRSFARLSKLRVRVLFDDTYQKLYGRTYPDNPVEFVTFKVRASLPQRPFRLPPLAQNERAAQKLHQGQASGLFTAQKETYSVHRLRPPEALPRGPDAGAGDCGRKRVHDRRGRGCRGAGGRVRVCVDRHDMKVEGGRRKWESGKVSTKHQTPKTQTPKHLFCFRGAGFLSAGLTAWPSNAANPKTVSG